MPLSNAVVRLGQHQAEVVEFDASHVSAHHLGEHTHYTRQHNSGVRTEHEFHSEVCQSLAGIPQVLITGSHTGLAAFRHYVEKHRPALQPQIVGWEIVDHPSEKQLVAFARDYLAKHARMATPAA